MVEEGADWGEEEEEGLSGTFHRPGGRTPAPAEGRIEGGCCCSTGGRGLVDRTGAGLETVALWNRKCIVLLLYVTHNPLQINITDSQFKDYEVKRVTCLTLLSNVRFRSIS